MTDTINFPPRPPHPNVEAAQIVLQEIKWLLEGNENFDTAFIDSVEEQIEQKTFCTDKQLQALENILEGLENAAR